MFASAPELAQFLQTATQDEADAGSPDVLDTAIANQALTSATADIQSACGWSITQETVTLRVAADRVILLPTLYLTAVSSVTDALGQVVDPDWYLWEEWGRLEFWYYEALIINRDYWRMPYPPRLTIVFTHGWPTAPDVIKGICLEVAAMKYSNPTALASSSRLGAVDVFRRSENDGINLEQDPRLAGYRRPR